MSLDPVKFSIQRQKTWIPVTDFSGFKRVSLPTITIVKDTIIATTEIGLDADADAAALVNDGIAATRTGITGVQRPVMESHGTLNPQAAEIIGSVTGLKMVTVTSDIGHHMLVPTEWDRKQPIDARIIWTCDAAAVGDRDITWKLLWAGLIPGVTALVNSPGNVLTFDAQAPVGFAKTEERTAAKTIAAGAIADTALYMQFLVEMDAFDAALSENKFLLGIEFEYSPRLGRLHGRRADPWSA